jgi:hypothetical protein
VYRWGNFEIPEGQRAKEEKFCNWDTVIQALNICSDWTYIIDIPNNIKLMLLIHPNEFGHSILNSNRWSQHAIWNLQWIPPNFLISTCTHTKWICTKDLKFVF